MRRSRLREICSSGLPGWNWRRPSQCRFDCNPKRCAVLHPYITAGARTARMAHWRTHHFCPADRVLARPVTLLVDAVAYPANVIGPGPSKKRRAEAWQLTGWALMNQQGSTCLEAIPTLGRRTFRCFVMAGHPVLQETPLWLTKGRRDDERACWTWARGTGKCLVHPRSPTALSRHFKPPTAGRPARSARSSCSP
jgi:hypothetical protein